MRNAGKLVEEFEREYGEEDEEVRRQEQAEEEKEFNRRLPERYTAKLIHRWGNRRYKGRGREGGMKIGPNGNIPQDKES